MVFAILMWGMLALCRVLPLQSGGLVTLLLITVGGLRDPRIWIALIPCIVTIPTLCMIRPMRFFCGLMPSTAKTLFWLKVQ